MVRFKNRYFLCEIISEDPRCRQFIEERIVHIRYVNAYTAVVLFCCRKDFYRLLWSSLPFISHLENRSQHCPCSFNTLHVGATIRTCQKFLIQYNRDQLLLLLRNCTSEADREAIRKSVQSCALVGVEQLQSKDEESEENTD
ncbi:hypothetical protein Chor_000023 [Crotalus horridus]